MRGVRIRHNQLGERVALELGIEGKASGALQIVEAVAVLQLFELILEDEVEGRAQHAAERHRFLGETANPQVDIAQTRVGDAVKIRDVTRGAVCPGSRAIQEFETDLAGASGPPRTSAIAAARFATSVVALVIVSCVP